jgi:hypothetical protein
LTPRAALHPGGQHEARGLFTGLRPTLRVYSFANPCQPRGILLDASPLPEEPLKGEPSWFQDERGYDLIVALDDATSEIYYAQRVEEESTRTVMAALRR